MIQEDDQGSDTPCCGDEMVQNEPGYEEENAPDRFSHEPVRYFDGVLKLTTTDISSNGFGKAWGMTRSWTNGPGYANTSFYGSGWLVSQLPYMQSWNNGNTVVVITNGVNAREFDANGGNWVEHFYLQDKLTYNSTAHEFTLTDTTGNQIKFSDFSTSLPANQQGQLKSLTDRDGNVTQVTSRTTDGKPAEIQRSTTVNGTTYTESYLYSYISSGTNAGLMQNVTLRRQVNGGSWTTIRQVAYTYYDGVLAHGNANDLRTATIQDGSGNTLDTKYYRYYVSESTGYQHALKYLFNADSYARLVAALGTNIDSLTDTQVAPYADNYFEYDSSKRVTKEVTQGGLFTHLYGYTGSSFTNGYNSWKYKTTETLPDNNQLIVYSNYAGEAMLTVFYDTGSLQKWDTFNKYDSAGRVILRALPSAVTGYDDTKSDLLNYNSLTGLYQYLSNNSGLIEITDFGTSTTATSTTPGDVAGYLKDAKIEQGQQGTAILVSGRQYIAQTAGSITIYPVANMTRYRNTDGTGTETTSYSYTFFSGTDQIQSAAVSLPVISSAQNGPGTSDVLTVFNDAYGRPIWSKDADGFINYIQYDPATGAVTKTITDVDTTRTGDFQNLPNGWSTPSGGGLNLITLYQVDGVGRPTKITDPLGNVTYKVYLDTNHEIRTYPGWNSSTHLPTGPTQDLRLDETNSYVETLTMSATPAVDGNGNPTGGEAIANVQTLSRTYLNSANQLIYRDNYFNLSGLTYSTSPNLGTENVNFYRTRYAYSANGLLNRIQFPTGTIQRTVYDSHKRLVSEWIGTNDNGATDSDPTGGGASGNNMKQIAGNVYDGGGIGGTVRRIETAYDTGDRPYLFTSYNAASGGSIVNQVQDAYNGLGQLITEYQAHSGAVNTSTTPKVQYAYSLMAGGVNNSRLTSMTYPNGRVLNFNYATGVDNTISRLTSISDSTASLESLSYLGLSTVVDRSHPQPGVDLTYIKQTGEPNGDAGDQYTGLDRFGRVVDQRWIITATGTATDRFQYGYDRDSNRLYRDNLVNSSFGELYHANGPSNGYDLLNQLTNFARGTLNSSKDTITSPSHSQSWALDALGNWSSVTTDGSTQTRTANQQNEITSISGLTTPTYDANGNMTGDQNGKTLIFDAWNRLVQMKNGTTVLETYGYDGRGWRITENPGTVRDLYYSMLWQLLEEDVGGSMQDQYLWSPVYVDALVERDTPTQRMYVQQDATFNVTALVDTSGNVQERYVYDPFGAVTILTPSWAARGSSSYSWIYFHQGGRFDNATGLYGYRHRDLSPTLGRWVELDPVGLAPDSNPYRYVSNNPTTKADPSGFWPQWLNNASNWVGDQVAWYVDAGSAFPGAVADTFASGEAWDSFQGYAVGMPDMVGDQAVWVVNTLGGDLPKPNLAGHIPPLYGNVQAYNGGQHLGHGTVINMEVAALLYGLGCLGGAGDVAYGAGEGEVAAGAAGTAGDLAAAEEAAAEAEAEAGVGGAEAAGEGASAPASTPVGHSGAPFGSAVNPPAYIEGQYYSADAVNAMQCRGIPPSVVQNTIENGEVILQPANGTVVFYDQVNNVSVAVNPNTGTVVTVFQGMAKPKP